MKYNIFNSITTWSLKKRITRINSFFKDPVNIQNNVLKKLIEKAKDTEWGKKHRFKSIKNYEEFKSIVPIVKYENITNYIQKMKEGKPDVLWPGNISFFAKSSGTTNDRSKYIPITNESLNHSHLRAGKDMLSIYINLFPDSKIFNGKSLMVGGSKSLGKERNYIVGDLSSILISNLPIWTTFMRTPSIETALMSDWEKKMEKIADEAIDQNISSMSGVPSWTMVLLRKVLQKTGKSKICEVWPNLELYMHGGISMQPYKKEFDEVIGKKINYLEIYNASEGFFGIQNYLDDSSLLLMLDYGIFYEFIPIVNNEQKVDKITSIEGVKLNVNYAMVISTNGGLWRYNIGDTIIFTSLKPYKIKISGRTKHFINAFGEELMVSNTDLAIQIACEKMKCKIKDYTAAPKFLKNSSGCHEWIIDFEKIPENKELFTDLLDKEIRAINSDYDAKRYKDILLKKPIIHFCDNNFFYEWLKKNKKIGGQNKVPRLSNSRDKLEDLLKYL
ncbi:MAG: hypothetical protein CBC73_03990 [Flavobacteriales bacterium TMED113]|nr:MAG: hypothetical protein CBC73_03990 [Flavobacteriales bacterium TMED113]